MASGAKPYYGAVSTAVRRDTTPAGILAFGSGLLDADGRFSLGLTFFSGFSAPGDTVRIMLYAQSPYWQVTPFDSMPITIHLAKLHEPIVADTVHWVSLGTPKLP